MNSSLLNSLKLKYTNIDHYNILIITWNVGAKIESKELLRNLIFNHLNKHAFSNDTSATSSTTTNTNTTATNTTTNNNTTIASQSPEIIVFGLQEMVELSTSNVIGTHPTLPCIIKFLSLLMIKDYSQQHRYDYIYINHHHKIDLIVDIDEQMSQYILYINRSGDGVVLAWT